MTILTLPCSYLICQPPGNPEGLRARGDTGPASSLSPRAALVRAATKPETSGAVRRRLSRRDARLAFFHFRNLSAIATTTVASPHRETTTETGRTVTKRTTARRVSHERGRRGGTLTSALTAGGRSARQKTARTRRAMMPSAPPCARPTACTARERMETRRRCVPSP